MPAPLALVTGATGFIGHHVVQALLGAGWRVRALVRPRSDVTALATLGSELCLGDVGEPSSLDPAVAGCAAVFHLASLLKVPWKADFHRVNVAGAEHVAAACARASAPPTLVLMSSLAAAGPAPRGGQRAEAEPPAPVSVYGRVKAAAEAAALGHAHRVPLSVVRPPMVFGERDRGTLALFRTATRGLHLVPQRRPGRIGLIHASDLAQAMLRIAAAGERAAGPGGPVGQGVYHVAHPGVALPYDQFGGLLAEALGRPVRALRLPGPVTWTVAAAAEGWARLRDRPAPLNLDKYREATAGDWVCATGRIQGLGFAPTHTVAERLRQTVAWYRAEGWL